MDWYAPALVIALSMLVAALVISAGVAHNRHKDSVRRQAMITRRLQSLGNLPGEITQVCAGGNGVHAIEEPEPAADILDRLRKERGEGRAA